MPECLKGKWKFFPFNPGKVGSFAYRVHDTDVDMGKIMVKASYDEKRENFNIRYYDKNLCALPEENSDGNFMSFWNLYWEKASRSNMSMV